MKLLIQPQAVSWKERMVKVCGRWAKVHPTMNMVRFRIGEDLLVEIVTNLDGKKVIERIYE